MHVYERRDIDGALLFPFYKSQKKRKTKTKLVDGWYIFALRCCKRMVRAVQYYVKHIAK